MAQWARFQSEVENLDVGVLGTLSRFTGCFKHILSNPEPLPIILVNNVGRSHSYPIDFVETPDDEIDSILQINVNATVKVTKAIVPGMVQRRRGLVIGSGSFSGISVVSPMLATYAGSKSFLSSFLAALAEEVKGKGVDVETLNTYFVVSSLWI